MNTFSVAMSHPKETVMPLLGQSSKKLREWAPLPIRLIVGYGFMAHGYAKLRRGPETFAVVLHTLGVPLPVLGAWATTAVEIVGGAAVLFRPTDTTRQRSDGRCSSDSTVHGPPSLRLLLGEAGGGDRIRN
jgi:hypothetical protein